VPRRKLSAEETARYEEFRRLLVEERERAGLSQGELGAKLSPPRPQSYVAKIELGLRRLDPLEYLDIGHAVGFDPCRLLQRVDEIARKNSGKRSAKGKRSMR
jgi:ribosome-binding protein aMBF1 (putative translation factor)